MKELAVGSIITIQKHINILNDIKYINSLTNSSYHINFDKILKTKQYLTHLLIELCP
jgi:hypothetical protein